MFYRDEMLFYFHVFNLWRIANKLGMNMLAHYQFNHQFIISKKCGYCIMKKLRSLLLLMVCIGRLSAQTGNLKTEKKIDIVYTKINDWEGKLDLYLPEGKKDNMLVIYIHGGGWTHGNKEAEYEKIKIFIENGYTVANVEYRLAPQAAAPAAIEDVNCAIAYLLGNVKQYRFDPKKVVLMGGSAGAHLALLAGLQSHKPLFTAGCTVKPFKVAAIISKYGPTDLLTWEPATKPGSASATWVGKRGTDTAFLQSLSPFYSVSGRKIPVLFIHGDQDRTVPVEQSQKLYQKLKQLDYLTELYVVKDGKHGNFGAVETPKMDQKMLEFLAQISKLN